MNDPLDTPNVLRDWPTPSAVAQVLDVSERTVLRWALRGKLVARDVSGGDVDARYRIDPASVARVKAGKPVKDSSN